MAKTKSKGMNAAMAGMDMSYQVEDDLRTLCRAQEIQDDPKRLKAAQKLAKTKCEDMQEIAGMKPDSEKNDKQ